MKTLDRCTLTAAPQAVKSFSVSRLRRQRDVLRGADGGVRVVSALEKVAAEVRALRALRDAECVVRLREVLHDSEDDAMYMGAWD
jgi:hypothetical protein